MKTKTAKARRITGARILTACARLQSTIETRPVGPLLNPESKRIEILSRVEPLMKLTSVAGELANKNDPVEALRAFSDIVSAANRALDELTAIFGPLPEQIRKG